MNKNEEKALQELRSLSNELDNDVDATISLLDTLPKMKSLGNILKPLYKEDIKNQKTKYMFSKKNLKNF